MGVLKNAIMSSGVRPLMSGMMPLRVAAASKSLRTAVRFTTLGRIVKIASTAESAAAVFPRPAMLRVPELLPRRSIVGP